MHLRIVDICTVSKLDRKVCEFPSGTLTFIIRGRGFECIDKDTVFVSRVATNSGETVKRYTTKRCCYIGKNEGCEAALIVAVPSEKNKKNKKGKKSDDSKGTEELEVVVTTGGGDSGGRRCEGESDAHSIPFPEFT